MDAHTLTVHWHDENQPVYSVHFQPNHFHSKDATKSARLVTTGGDNNIRVWELEDVSDSSNKYSETVPKESSKSDVPVSIRYLSTLKKHTQAVNVARFNQKGDRIASGGDDGSLILWSLLNEIIKEFGEKEDDLLVESWKADKVLRSSTSEIYDLAWSPDAQYIITGSMDNIARIYNTSSGELVYSLSNHSHYVQGVCWDPRNEYFATQSADRSVIIYKVDHVNNAFSPLVYNRVIRWDIPMMKHSNEKDKFPQMKTSYLYHPETLQSFFRRLTFSPDGSLLLTPLGFYKLTEPSTQEDTVTNTIYIYTRAGLKKGPVCHIPGLKKPATVIRFSPKIYQLQGDQSIFKLPYRMVFAVATHDSIILYNTQDLKPMGLVTNLHYSSITDCTWDLNGETLIISSADGFCSFVRFKKGAFGDVLHDVNEEPDFWKKYETSKENEPEIDLLKPVKEKLETTAKSLAAPIPKKSSLLDKFIAKPLSVDKFTASFTVKEEIQTEEKKASSTLSEEMQTQENKTGLTPDTKVKTSITAMRPEPQEYLQTANKTESSTTTEKELVPNKKKRRIAPTLLTTSAVPP